MTHCKHFLLKHSPLGVFQEHKVLLTGTPLQNTVEELFSLLHFLEPARFPSENTFMQEFGDLKTEEQVSLQIHGDHALIFHAADIGVNI